ncbi:hypothetical protein Pelo_19866 [Pelomyxa schiedti]|nr:hypothetical protein Pelo_19866 [Pelomyxa schiedti]
MSATWHGIYTGYFMAFVTIIFHRFTVQVARQRLRPQAIKNAYCVTPWRPSCCCKRAWRCVYGTAHTG